MTRLIPALLALLVLIGSASAERTVVTALASETNPDNLVSVAFDAKINACDDGVFNITILVPERYDPEEIWAINNSIVFTNDSWAHAKMAIGKIVDPNLIRYSKTTDAV